MISSNGPRDGADRARVLMRDCFANGMGGMEKAESRMVAALRDILAHPGSLIRAVVAYLMAIEMGLPEAAAMAMGCGIEYLHTASLIFDDLPAMDDSRLRRGAACVHVVHGEAVAMLAALAMINRGYAMLWEGISGGSPPRRASAAAWIDQRLGIGGVIGGQAFDLSGWRGEQNAADVSEVAARKTGDLLRLTLVLPAIVGKGTQREVQLLDRLALLRGLAYQAADDLKDVVSSAAISGKCGGRDEILGRLNLVSAEGMTAALARFRRLIETGDRVQAALPGAVERWRILEMLRVPVPVSIQGHGESGFPEAI